MGEAMLAAVLESEQSTPEAVSVADVREERRQYLKNKYGVVVAGSNKEAAVGKDVVVLAVKPQNLAEAMAELNGCLEPAQLVLSVIAGARINTLCLGLSHDLVVRAMPNTPARIGQGMAAWTASLALPKSRRNRPKPYLLPWARRYTSPMRSILIWRRR